MDSSCHPQGDIVYRERAESRGVPLYLSTVELRTRQARDLLMDYNMGERFYIYYILSLAQLKMESIGSGYIIDVRLEVFCFIGLAQIYSLLRPKSVSLSTQPVRT